MRYIYSTMTTDFFTMPLKRFSTINLEVHFITYISNRHFLRDFTFRFCRTTSIYILRNFRCSGTPIERFTVFFVISNLDGTEHSIVQSCRILDFQILWPRLDWKYVEVLGRKRHDTVSIGRCSR